MFSTKKTQINKKILCWLNKLLRENKKNYFRLSSRTAGLGQVTVFFIHRDSRTVASKPLSQPNKIKGKKFTWFNEFHFYNSYLVITTGIIFTKKKTGTNEKLGKNYSHNLLLMATQEAAKKNNNNNKKINKLKTINKKQ